jgi:hypothetical protein
MGCISSRAAVAWSLLGLLALPSPASPQEQPRSRVTIAAGAAHLAHQDLIHTPFVHGGVAPLSLGVRYERSGDWVHFAEGGYRALTSRLTRPYPILHGGHSHESPPHRYHFVDAASGLGRRVPAGSGRTAALGAALRLDLQAADYSYGVEPNFGYFISPSLDLWYRRELGLPAGGRLSGRAMAPLLSWVARSPYGVNDDRFIENIEPGRPLPILVAFLADGELAGWDRLQRLDVAIDFHRPLVRRLDLGAAYRFGVLRHAEPRPLTVVRNALDLTTSIRF